MRRFQITFKGQRYELDVEEISTDIATTNDIRKIQAAPAPVAVKASSQPQTSSPASAPASGGKNVQSPMPGKILAVNIKEGESVKRGAVIFILEAMKMQNEIMATQDGTVSRVNVSVGQTVSTGEILATFA